MVVILTSCGAGRITATLMAQAWWGGWGKGSGTASKSDGNFFETEAGRSQASLVQLDPFTIQYVWLLVAQETVTITEAGIFPTETSNTIIFHSTFDGIPLFPGDRIEFTLVHTTS